MGLDRQGTPSSLSGADYYVTFQSLLQEVYGRPPDTHPWLGEAPIEG